jgi:hypothetical protein
VRIKRFDIDYGLGNATKQDKDMNELRCKPGDFAVVISAKCKRNLGIIVKVIELDDRTGPVRYALDTPPGLLSRKRL